MPAPYGRERTGSAETARSRTALAAGRRRRGCRDGHDQLQHIHHSRQEAVGKRRAVLREAMQVSYEAADEVHAQARGFRNVLVIATVVLAMLVVAVCLFGTLRPAAIPLCFEPSPGSVACPSSSDATGPSSFDVIIVALMGLLGGALSVAFTVQRLRGTSAPYDIPLALTINKLPSGVLTSIVGLILIQGDFIPGLSELDNQGQILAYAILFGFAQHLATRYIDQKAEEVIESVPKKSSQPAKQRDKGRRRRQEKAAHK